MRNSVNSSRRLSESEPTDETYKIFINNADSFNGKYILSSLYKQGFEEVEPSEKSQSMDDAKTDENSSFSHKLIEESGDEGEDEATSSLAFDQIINDNSQVDSDPKYKIYGSLTSPSKQKPEELFQVTAENNEQFKNIITKCNCVIYDISLDDSQIAKALTTLYIIEQDFERKQSLPTKHDYPPVLFILISTCMTWASTPRLDPADPDPIPFEECDHRKRKPHPNFKEHYDCEKEVMKKGRKFKRKLHTIVVCAGVTYGYEENMLAFLFKRAWSSEPHLPIFGRGTNFVPLIHVEDLAQIVCKLVDVVKCDEHYILAVEQTPTTLKHMVKYISRALGSGKVEYVEMEEAYLYPEIDHNIFDTLTANIVMEPEYVSTSLGITWRNEMNFVENIENIVEEFKTSRSLEPLKIVIIGPPCSGKTKLSHLLSEHYNLHYISTKIVTDLSEKKLVQEKQTTLRFNCETISKGTNKHCNISKMNLNELTLSDQEDARDLFGLDVSDSEEENYQKMSAEDHKDLNKKLLRQSDEYISVLLNKEMKKNHSVNLGFVLDGSAKTFKQATLIFKKGKTDSSIVSDDLSKHSNIPDQKIMPTYVISLDAPNDFIFDKISRIPEEEMQAAHFDERDIIRRLNVYRKNNIKGSDTLSYFHDSETEIVDIDVSEFPSDNMDCIFYICTKIIGPPRGFGLSDAEIEQFDIINEYQKQFRLEKEKLQQQLQKEKERKEFEEKIKTILMEQYYAKVKEDRLLTPKIEKYRIFLSRNILPFIFEAITSVVEKKPENPQDFFAKYLFKNNPNGRMYHPMYARFRKTSNTRFQS